MEPFAIYFTLWIFGVSAWIAVNGVQNQEWKLVQKLTEGDRIAPSLTVLTQAGNILPFIYVVCRYTVIGEWINAVWQGIRGAGRCVRKGLPGGGGIESGSGSLGGGSSARELAPNCDQNPHAPTLAECHILHKWIGGAIVSSFFGFLFLSSFWTVESGGTAICLYLGFAVLSGACCLSTLTYWPFVGYVCRTPGQRFRGDAGESMSRTPGQRFRGDAGESMSRLSSVELEAKRGQHVARGASALAAGEACGMLVISCSNALEKVLDFSASAFFSVLAAVCVASFGAFWLLRRHVLKAYGDPNYSETPASCPSTSFAMVVETPGGRRGPSLLSDEGEAEVGPGPGPGLLAAPVQAGAALERDTKGHPLLHDAPTASAAADEASEVAPSDVGLLPGPSAPPKQDSQDPEDSEDSVDQIPKRVPKWLLWTALFMCNAFQSGLFPSLTVYACARISSMTDDSWGFHNTRHDPSIDLIHGPGHSRGKARDDQLYYLVSTLPGFLGPFLSVLAGVAYQSRLLLLISNAAWVSAALLTLGLSCGSGLLYDSEPGEKSSDSPEVLGAEVLVGSSDAGHPPLYYLYLIIQSFGVACIFYAKPAVLAWLKDDLALSGMVLQAAQLVGSVGFYFVAVTFAE